MNKIFLTAIMATALFFASCTDKTNQENVKASTTETANDDIIKSTSMDKDGNKLDLFFNNTKNTVTLNFAGETVELEAERAGSGIWYKNDQYELRGKGNDLTLTKNGQVVFEHQDDIVNVESKSKTGDVLNMTFNNTEGTVKAYLNGGSQIDLVQERAASGIWYKNDEYELRGKGDSYFLTKDGETVFEN